MPSLATADSQMQLLTVEPCGSFAPHYHTNCGETLVVKSGRRAGASLCQPPLLLAPSTCYCRTSTPSPRSPLEPRLPHTLLTRPLHPAWAAGVLDVVLVVEGQVLRHTLRRGDLAVVPTGKPAARQWHAGPLAAPTGCSHQSQAPPCGPA